jgi:hypothetical protein
MPMQGEIRHRTVETNGIHKGSSELNKWEISHTTRRDAVGAFRSGS